MRCLIIDNYDSFTWNLADYVAQSFGVQPVVVRNDEYTWRELLALGNFGGVIVSPGPGSVTNRADFNVSRDALEQLELPVLGVCLGHQGLAHVCGARVERASVPFHGRQSAIHHDGSELFVGLPSVFQAVRYHSLVVNPDSIPAELQVTARSECGLVMGLRHRSQPKWGVQFHPESILTFDGMQIIKNFRDEARRFSRRRSSYPAPRVREVAEPTKPMAAEVPGSPAARSSRTVRLISRRLQGNYDPEAVFVGLFGKKKYSVWLDGHAPGNVNARFSFMGAPNMDAVLLYHADEGPAAVERHLSHLDQDLEQTTVQGGEELPFEFRGGYLGYMTYEMKAAFGASTRHRNAMPDSAWMRLDRFIAFDHQSRDLWVVAVVGTDEERVARAWMDDVAAAVTSQSVAAAPQPRTHKSLAAAMDFDRSGYLRAIDLCKQKIAAGESYEICLTNSFTIEGVDVEPLDLYRTMRKGNAAPYSSFIRLDQHSILSTSPERFLRVNSAGTIQTKPIKGTSARSDDAAADQRSAQLLATSEKDRAENLMIVDLMRNDLSRVSEPGSVRVPKLMDIESFKTVHQMVSTVESKLKAEYSLVDLLRAVFPGGSITGAPKIRTMEILDATERSPRGVYCGSIGYLGYNRVADINIAIRTLSYDGKDIKFGAGGAITYLSQPENEFDEIVLKAEALLRPVWQHLGRGQRFESVVRGHTLHVEGGAIDGALAQEPGSSAVACNV